CDVILCCDDSMPSTIRAIESLLGQRDSIVILHLVDDGGDGRQTVARFRHHWNVRVHHNPVRIGIWASLHQLVPKLVTNYVAIQMPHACSWPHRIAFSVNTLELHGGDFLGAAVATKSGLALPELMEVYHRRSVAPETLVIRRAAL